MSNNCKNCLFWCEITHNQGDCGKLKSVIETNSKVRQYLTGPSFGCNAGRDKNTLKSYAVQEGDKNTCNHFYKPTGRKSGGFPLWECVHCPETVVSV